MMKKFLVLAILSAAAFSLMAQRSFIVVDSIHIEGNKKTIRDVLLRELAFQQKDTLLLTHIDQVLLESNENLMNTELFNFVEIDTISQGSVEHIDVLIQVTEQWYILILPMAQMADRNFNEWWKTKDFERLDYGFLIIKENFRGRRERIKIKAMTGYNEHLELEYEVPFFDKKKHFGLVFNGELLRSHEINARTENDEVIYFSDEKKYPIKKNMASVGLVYRNKIRTQHIVTAGFSSYSFMDTIQQINPDFQLNNKSGAKFFSLSYEFENDYRDYDSYPLEGHYINFTLEKNGLGLVNEVVDFLRFRGYFNRYWKLRERWYAASGLTLSFADEKGLPYFAKSGLGYVKEFVRSYEANVINSNAFGLLRSNIKFAALPQTSFNLDFIPLEQFNKLFLAIYVNAFVDVGYADPIQLWELNGNTLGGELLIGKGIGVDFITYYERVMRLEYSWDKKNKGGFYVHFVAPI